MKNQNFGIEIELTGITREKAALTMATYFGTRHTYEGGTYDTWIAKDQQGRTWKAVSDSSIRAELKDGSATSDIHYRCEIVSPICQYADIETVQEIVRLLRAEGARANNSCGIHVHVDAAPHTAQSLRNLANIFASREDMLVAALGIEAARMHYCQKTDKGFMNRLNTRKPASRDQIQTIWYNGRDESYMHYSQTRYRMLNLHAVFSHGTVEFRCFNGSTHAGEIKAYIQFCLAVSHQALTQRSATYKPVVTDNAKYTFRCWLLRLGLIGDEFKTARLHLMKRLEGNSAWRHAS
jgi:hypothetical protein